jgi:CRISPR-associated endonuclease Cas2
MSKECAHWVCTYDICDPKRLIKIHRLLCMLGIAINYSVFYLYLSPQQFEQLSLKLKQLVHIEDDVRLYRAASLQSATIIGVLNPNGILLINPQGECLLG